MPDAPLRAFSPPAGRFFDHLQVVSNASSNLVIAWILFAVSVCWIIYTLVAIYHWVKYSHAALVAIPAIAVHLAISLILMGYAISGVFGI